MPTEKEQALAAIRTIYPGIRIPSSIEEWSRGPETATYTYELLFTFAGSGEESWKRKDSSGAKIKPEDVGFTKTKREGTTVTSYERVEQGGGDEDYLVKMTLELKGPSKLKGSIDRGDNSTRATLRLALQDFNTKMAEIQPKLKVDEKVSVKIEGFSRGGTAANAFCRAIEAGTYGKLINVVIVVIDAVHGGGKGSSPSMFSITALQPSETTLPESEAIVSSVRVLPVKAKHSKFADSFSPQQIKGVKTACIVYGPHATHDSGTFGEYSWKKVPLLGAGWASLGKGLFFADSTEAPHPKVSGNKGNEPVEVVKIENLSALENAINKIFRAPEFSGSWFKKKFWERGKHEMLNSSRDLEIINMCTQFFGGDPAVQSYIDWYKENVGPVPDIVPIYVKKARDLSIELIGKVNQLDHRIATIVGPTPSLDDPKAIIQSDFRNFAIPQYSATRNYLDLGYAPTDCFKQGVIAHEFAAEVGILGLTESEDASPPDKEVKKYMDDLVVIIEKIKDLEVFFGV
jgi:hypothetical protein